MKTEETENKFTSGGLVAKNTLYNLLGYGIPLLFALIIIPLLIKGLGEEKFGILYALKSAPTSFRVLAPRNGY